VGVHLTFKVVVVPPAGLDDQPGPLVGQLENTRLDQPPAVVTLDDGVREPIPQQRLLIGVQPFDA
jgi:hypothetical protein